MTAKKESNEVAEVKTGIAIAAPEFMDDADFGHGFEGVDGETFAIPFIQVLQKMSPIVDEDSPAYIAGAKAGMLYNSVTRKFYDGKAGLVFIPVFFKRTYILWGGREGDGGFKGEFSVDEIEAIRDDESKISVVDGKLYVPDAEGKVNEKKSDYYADTRSHYVLAIDPETGEFGQAIISLSSSQIKSSKMLMTALQQKKVNTPNGLRTPPTFANMVRMTTAGKSNEKGNWSGAEFTLEGLVTDKDLYQIAREFHKQCIAGEVNVDYNKADAASAQGEDVSTKPQDAEGF